MPNLKLFKRRSSGNALEGLGEPPASVQEESPAGSSFRVLERRPESSGAHADKRVSKASRPFQSPLQSLRGRSEEHLGAGLQKAGRGSGGTTTSGSSGYYPSPNASARHSSSSTLPSSVDQEPELDEELFPRKTATSSMPYQSINEDDPLPPPPSFTSRAARAFSFGRQQSRQGGVAKAEPLRSNSPVHSAPKSPDTSRQSPARDRSMTTSSYASTAKPVKTELDLDIGTSNFGDDFGNMFSGIGQKSREDAPLPSPPVASFHRTDSEPMYPPRTLSRQAFTPSPNLARNGRDDPGSPYSFDGRGSMDELMSNSALSSPRLFDEAPPPPAHASGMARAFLGQGKPGYSLVPERNPSPNLERQSSDSQSSQGGIVQDGRREDGYGNRQTHLEDGDRWERKVELREPQQESLTNAAPTQSHKMAPSVIPANPSYLQATAGAARGGAVSPSSEEDGSLFAESSSSTPKARRSAYGGVQDQSMFDSSPVGPPSRAVRPGDQRTESGPPRKLTRAQYEAMQKSGETNVEHSDDEVHQEDDYDDDDDAERAKQLSKQRRKQEANMAVYRQQMKKVTGGGPSDLPSARPSMERASSSIPAAAMAGLHLGGMGGTPPTDAVRGKQTEDDDEDVPLGILQAHGFPGGNRPPSTLGQTEEQRRISVAGSVANGGAGQGNLPPFARRLPADPYFGASLVNPANRESLAFSSAGSAYGGAAPQQMGHAGGLVGIIASEERAKASRRGSPNLVTGTYGMPLPQNMAPQMPRTMSMGSVVAPQVYTPTGHMPGMPPMPQMPQMPMMGGQDPAQIQMQQFMQMQMQLMQNMLAVQQQQMGGQTPGAVQQSPDYFGSPQRPMSTMLGPPGGPNQTNQGRAMTMMNPPPSWDFNGGQRPTSTLQHGYTTSQLNVGGPGPGYTPSIAPSERSNIGQPSRYRPVSMAPNDSGRSQSMTSSLTLQAFTNPQQQQKSTIRIIDKPKGAPKVSTRVVDPDEDEDEGWAEMAKKRSEKKFGWRKKESKASQEPALSDLYKTFE